MQTWGDVSACMAESGGGAEQCTSRDTTVSRNIALTCTLPICDPSSYPYSPGSWRGSRIIQRTVRYGPKKSKNASLFMNFTNVSMFEAPQTWDGISFGLTTNGLAEGNLVMGGDSPSGCGMIADIEPHNLTMLSNVLDHTGAAGIGIAGGDHIVVINNTVFNDHAWADGRNCMGGNTSKWRHEGVPADWQQIRIPCPTGSNSAIYVCSACAWSGAGNATAVHECMKRRNFGPVTLIGNVGFATTGYPAGSCAESGLNSPGRLTQPFRNCD